MNSEPQFLVYALNGDEHFVYVRSDGEYQYWQFNWIAGEENAWLYTTYSQNCPALESKVRLL